MKRIGVGIVWFIAFWLGLTLLMSIVVGVWASRSVPPGANMQQGIDAATAFVADHAALLTTLRISILLLALLGAVIGTLKGVLPGTKKPPA
ncbi:MAG TPA: hypothetical protein VHP13_05350 [Gammaproteobacteria bacterium]|jgi:hypothetical protein|nr:hypothetical protein [Gammaproteobacteria bacterium]